MNKIFLILFIFCFYGTSKEANYRSQDKARIDSSNKICYVIKSNSEENWFDKNQGTFLGALLAGLIAILSVYLTSKANKRYRLEKDTEIYCGLLYSIKAELIYQNINHDNLSKEMEAIKHNSLIANEIITDSPSRTISLNFLKDIRSKIISTEVFNTHILFYLSAYINKCELINSDIKFERLIKLNEKFKDKVDFPKTTQNYFDTVIIQIKNVRGSIPILIKKINEDLEFNGKPIEIDESEYFNIAS